MKRLVEVIVFTLTPCPFISDEKNSTDDEAWQLAIEVQDRQWVLAGAPTGTPFVCQWPGGQSLQIHPNPEKQYVCTLFFAPRWDLWLY